MPQSLFETAIDYVIARVALMGGSMGEIMLPNGDAALWIALPGDSTEVIFNRAVETATMSLTKDSSAVCADLRIGKPGLLASFLHNIDCQIFLVGDAETVDYHPEILRLADAIAENCPQKAKWLHDNLAHGIDFQLLLDLPFEDVNAAANDLRSVMKSGRKPKEFVALQSIVAWNRKISYLTIEPGDIVHSTNGEWTKIQHETQRVEAARSLGYLEGNFNRKNDHYAFRYTGKAFPEMTGSIVAVAELEDGELSQLIKHRNFRQSGTVKLMKDLGDLIQHLDHQQPQAMSL